MSACRWVRPLGRPPKKPLVPSFFRPVYRLTRMHVQCIYICMRTTLNLQDELVQRASELTGIKEKTALVRMGLEALIARESAKRLAKLGGTDKNLQPIPRRRSAG